MLGTDAKAVFWHVFIKWSKSSIYSTQIKKKMVMYFDNWYEMVRTSTLNQQKDRNQNLTVLSLMNITWTLCRENPFLEELVWWQHGADGWNKKGGDEEENLVSQPIEQDCIFSSYLSGYA